MKLEKEIKKLDEIKANLESISVNFQKEKQQLLDKYQKIMNTTEKLRIVKKKLKDGSIGYEIFCMGCYQTYTTNKDPYAALKDDRPLHRNCRTRVFFKFYCNDEGIIVGSHRVEKNRRKK